MGPIAALAAVAAAPIAAPPTHALDAGTTDWIVQHEEARRVRVHIPLRRPTDGPRALVVALHGGGGQGLATSEPGRHPLAVFQTVADREGFVVAFPEGSMGADGRRGWTDCRADNTLASHTDDLGFLRATIAQLRATFDMPPARVFVAGTSNGAQMALALATTAAEEVAALAVSSGNLPATPRAGPCTTGPSRPVPALFTHGTADTAMPYLGGCVANLGGGCSRGRVLGAEATRDAWRVHNGLTATEATRDAVERDPQDAGSAERFTYAGPAPVVWWRLDGAGHPPPSLLVPVATTPAAGPQNRDIEFAEVAWAFFAAQLPEEPTL